MPVFGSWRSFGWLAVWVGALLLIGGGIATRLAGHLRGVDRPFCAQRWLKGDARDRGQMVTDLLQGGWLECLGRSDVVKLLGEPDADDEHEVSYAIDTGVRVFNHVWPHHLVLVFDDLGQFLSASLRD